MRSRSSPWSSRDCAGSKVPVTAHRLVDVIDASEGLPRPEPPFVNRTTELRLLHESFESHIASARCRSVTLIGSAGLGKSRLVGEFLRGHPQAETVLRSRCPAYGEGSALQPLIDVVGQAAGFTSDAEPAVAVERIRELLADHPEGALAVDGVARALGLAPGSTTQEETAWSIRICMETVARHRPLVLAFDDLHWAAPALLDVLEHLAEWARGAPILLLCLARPELLNARPTWARTPGAVTLQLEPLGTEPSRELAHLLLASATPGVEDTIVGVADGNPFFLEEIVTMLQEEGAIAPDATERDLSRIAIPPTISALLAARIDPARPGRPAGARTGCRPGSRVRTGACRGALAGYRDRRGDDAEDLAERDLVVSDPEAPGEGYRFRHALTREAAYDAIPSPSGFVSIPPPRNGSRENPTARRATSRSAITWSRRIGPSSTWEKWIPRPRCWANGRARTSPRPAAQRPPAATCAPPPGCSNGPPHSRREIMPNRPGVLMDLHEALLFAGRSNDQKPPSRSCSHSSTRTTTASWPSGRDSSKRCSGSSSTPGRRRPMCSGGTSRDPSRGSRTRATKRTWRRRSPTWRRSIGWRGTRSDVGVRGTRPGTRSGEREPTGDCRSGTLDRVRAPSGGRSPR